ncbi:M20/M25/M40 family metallo-hydrolase [Halalkalibacillus halophilus]|uniref:M20/M25/M40 family metallo-hydrolase n=1 Tax=Halalkalibacillus halophilus TaxID=392827 RepID=UPI000404C3F6|nr:M20/M25/M40 family metallo-hydrolase [Halalkalibacillus halophilus]
MGKWQSKYELKELLCNLVQYQSITGSREEIAIIEYIYNLLHQEEYFKTHSNHIKISPLEDGRELLTALVKRGTKKKTIILLSHIDVVDVDDYGSYKDLAFRPNELTKKLKEEETELPDEARRDLLNSKESWLFGRGTMDMKAGTSLHMSMLEQAMEEEFDGNILLLVVPDEEANSLGMLEATKVLKELEKEEDLEYILCLNSEPMFRQFPEDDKMYLYSGSLGKILPGFLCYGKETHVGEPYHGLNANLMSSYLNKNLELNQTFVEKINSEVTPPPISLMNRDLKEQYSVQTPLTAVSMYNVLFMKQSVEDITKKLRDVMTKTAKEVKQHMNQSATQYFGDSSTKNMLLQTDISVFDFHDLYKIAEERYGKHEVERRHNLLVKERNHGDRDFSTLLVQDLAYMCKDLAPMIVLFYSPPFYPAVTSSQNKKVQSLLDETEEHMNKQFNRKASIAAYFNGISDLSFIGEDAQGDKDYYFLKENMPLEKIELSYLQEVEYSIPTANIGPLGKDAHQWTERLEVNYSFNELPHILTYAIKQAFQQER